MRVAYIAADGKQFLSEDDCANYEQELIEKSGCRFYDSEGVIVSDFDDAVMAYITEQGFTYMKDMDYEDIGLDIGINSAGSWFYFRHQWINLSDLSYYEKRALKNLAMVFPREF